MKKNHLLIVDDHPMVQEGLVSLLSNHQRIGQISTADCGKNALQLLARENIDLVFLDINLPDTNGIDLCYKITKQYENTKVVAVSSFNNKSFFKKIRSRKEYEPYRHLVGSFLASDESEN